MKLTHCGNLRGDARAGNKTPLVYLRETKNFWVTRDGIKFRKADGWPAGGGHWPMWTLDLSTVKVKEEA